jgi:hypothetical protein
VPGAGDDHARAAALYGRLVARARASEAAAPGGARPSAPPSLELALEHAYALYRWSLVDPGHRTDARAALDDLERRHPPSALEPALRARVHWLGERLR